MSECHQDKLRMASYKCSFARLYKKQGNQLEAFHWAQEAQDGFDRLGMESEAEEMKAICELILK